MASFDIITTARYHFFLFSLQMIRARKLRYRAARLYDEYAGYGTVFIIITL